MSLVLWSYLRQLLIFSLFVIQALLLMAVVQFNDGACSFIVCTSNLKIDKVLATLIV